MKKSLLAIALLLAVSLSPADAQGKHRHKHQDAVETTTQTNQDEALEAVSDTTTDVDDSTYTYDEDEDADSKNVSISVDPNDFDNPFSWFSGLWMAGIGGIMIAMFIVLLILFFLAVPVILLVWFLRYLMKRSEQKADMARMAMQQGYTAQQQNYAEQPQASTTTPPYMPQGSQKDEFLWRKGIRNLSIGVGLMFMFGFMGADALIGVGLLIACMGGGQMFMAWTTGNKSTVNKNKDSIGGEQSQSEQQ